MQYMRLFCLIIIKGDSSWTRTLLPCLNQFSRSSGSASTSIKLTASHWYRNPCNVRSINDIVNDVSLGPKNRKEPHAVGESIQRSTPLHDVSDSE